MDKTKIIPYIPYISIGSVLLLMFVDFYFEIGVIIGVVGLFLDVVFKIFGV